MKNLRNILLNIIIFFCSLILFYISIKYYLYNLSLDSVVFIVVLIIAIISYVTKYLNKKFKDYFLIFFFSISFSLYAFEFFIVNKITNIEDINSLNYQKTKLVFYENLKKKRNLRKYDGFVDPDPVMQIGAATFINRDTKKNSLLPLTGFANKLTINCDENGYMSIWVSDRFGFNNPNNVWDKKIDYFILGDSQAMGACVNRPQDPASQLKKFSNKNVVTVGVNGHGPLSNYATLKEYFIEGVESILWLHTEGTDIYNLKNEINNTILMNYLLNDNFTQNLKNKKKDLEKILLNEMNRELKKSHRENYSFNENFENKDKIFCNDNGIVFLRCIRYLIINDFKVYSIFYDILKKTNYFSKQKKSNFYFVYLPDYKRYKNKIFYDSYFKIKLICKIIGINFIDIKYYFETYYDDQLKFYPNRPRGVNRHFNYEGNKSVAKYIFNVIKK